MYGMLGKLDLCLQMAEMGIKESLTTSTHSSLPYLYYYASLAHYKMRNIPEAERYAKLCYAACYTTQDEFIMNHLPPLILKDQGMSFELLHSYKKHTN